MPDPPLVVVSSTQSARKSTVAHLLAARLEKCAWVSADALASMIVAVGRWPDAAGTSPEAERQRRLRLHNACLLARSFAEAGCAAVVDDIVIGEWVAHPLKELDGQRFGFVVLAPTLDAVRRREAGRGTGLSEQWAWLDEVLRSHPRGIGLWLGASDRTPRRPSTRSSGAAGPKGSFRRRLLASRGATV